MVTAEVICRVLKIKYKDQMGTGFTIERNNIQYIITAKHILKTPTGYEKNGIIEIMSNKVFCPYNADIFYHSNDDIDVAIIRVNSGTILTAVYNNYYKTEGLALSQEVYFLGYPYGLEMNFSAKPMGDLPVPLVKKACLSAFYEENNIQCLLLDGYNNPGFSGGPVCAKIGTDSTFSICGIVSGYLNNRIPVLNDNGIGTKHYINENAGIVKAYDILYAKEIIDAIK